MAPLRDPPGGAGGGDAALGPRLRPRRPRRGDGETEPPGRRRGDRVRARSPESLLANTHRALAASAIVQEADPWRFEAFHHALFHASFGEMRNIGDPSVLHRIAAERGLDALRLDAALAAGGGEDALREATEDARRRKITAVPAFVFGGREVLVGAHPSEALRQAAERATASG